MVSVAAFPAAELELAAALEVAAVEELEELEELELELPQAVASNAVNATRNADRLRI
ncbi:MAG: hypothetical protein ABSG43_28245 [Solirubrobacteraceae bacterium]